MAQRLRFTPARAGNTWMQDVQKSGGRGSPPRVRGILSVTVQ